MKRTEQYSDQIARLLPSKEDKTGDGQEYNHRVSLFK